MKTTDLEYDYVFSADMSKSLDAIRDCDTLTIPEAASIYHLTTNVCKDGIYDFIKKNRFTKDKTLTLIDLFNLTKDENGNGFFLEYLKSKSTLLIDKYKKVIVEGRIREQAREQDPVKKSSTNVILHNRATNCGKDLYIKAALWWAASQISVAYAHTDGEADLPSEYVWYDLYVYDAYSNTLLAESTGIYGSSSWQLVNSGSGYEIRK